MPLINAKVKLPWIIAKKFLGFEKRWELNGRKIIVGLMKRFIKNSKIFYDNFFEMK